MRDSLVSSYLFDWLRVTPPSPARKATPDRFGISRGRSTPAVVPRQARDTTGHAFGPSILLPPPLKLRWAGRAGKSFIFMVWCCSPWTWVYRTGHFSLSKCAFKWNSTGVSPWSFILLPQFESRTGAYGVLFYALDVPDGVYVWARVRASRAFCV